MIPIMHNWETLEHFHVPYVFDGIAVSIERYFDNDKLNLSKLRYETSLLKQLNKPVTCVVHVDLVYSNKHLYIIRKLNAVQCIIYGRSDRPKEWFHSVEAELSHLRVFWKLLLSHVHSKRFSFLNNIVLDATEWFNFRSECEELHHLKQHVLYQDHAYFLTHTQMYNYPLRQTNSDVISTPTLPTYLK